MVYDIPIFEETLNFTILRMRYTKRGLEERVLLLEIMGNFFLVIYILYGAFVQNFSFIKIFSHKLWNTPGLCN